MSDIDLATGLPTLPEGMCWRVIDITNQYWDLIGDHIKVQIVEEYTVRGYWDFSIFSIPRGYIKKIRVHESSVVFYKVGEDQTLKPVSKNDLTPELILETAKDVLDSYNRRLISEDLLGVYPPKKLSTRE